MVPFIILLLTTVVVSVSGQSCSFNGVDLSTKQGQYAVYSPDANQAYFMSICAPLAAGNQCGTQSPGASACMDQDNFGKTAYYNVGSWSTAAWSQMDNGLQYVMTGESCMGDPGTPYSSLVQFPCADSEGTMSVTLGSGCQTTFTWPTTLTCGGGGGGGPSGGAIAGIVITVLIVIGAIVGLLWYLNRTGRLETIKQAIQGRNGPNQPLIQSAASPQV